MQDAVSGWPTATRRRFRSGYHTARLTRPARRRRVHILPADYLLPTMRRETASAAHRATHSAAAGTEHAHWTLPAVAACPKPKRGAGIVPSAASAARGTSAPAEDQDPGK